jgi:sec-independent protein translocase protein TatC
VHRQYNEDLFESSKMTFGEHLEELRLSLLKAVLSFVIGFLVALLFAGRLVDYVQTPLKDALKDYYTSLNEKKYLEYLMEQRENGRPVPSNLEAAAKIFAEQGLVMEERWVDPYDMAETLNRINPNAIDKSALPKRAPDAAVKSENLVKMPMYHRIEDDPRVRVVGLRMEEPFVVYMKAAFVLGTVISSPFVFYFIWQFVAAGLYPHEQRYVHIFLPFSIGLFLAGAALAFFVVFQFVLAFLLSFYDWMNIDPDARISDWLSFVLILPLGFGIAFQLPLVMLFLERIGLLTVKTYTSSWKISVLVIAFLSMILTPSDPYSMMLMMTPLIGLYFFGIMLCNWMPRRATPFGETLD